MQQVEWYRLEGLVIMYWKNFEMDQKVSLHKKAESSRKVMLIYSKIRIFCVMQKT